VSALESWNYVALALHERSLPFPAFLKPATDLDATRKKLQSWKQTKSVPQWVERIRRFTSQRVPINSLRPVNDVRMLITTSDAKLQGRDADTLRWFTLAPAQLAAVRADHSRGALSLPTEAELLLVASLLQMQHSEIESFRLEIERHTLWLNSLFQQKALHTRLVTLDETPFTLASSPLRWSATEREGGESFSLRLVQADGSPAPTPLRVLSGAQVLYLAADTVFRGPTWFGEETLAEPSIDIPLQALAWCRRHRLPEPAGSPPAALDCGTPSGMSPCRWRSPAKCAKAPASAGTNYAHIRVTAVSSDRHHEEVLRDKSWITENERPRRDGSIVCHDCTQLTEVPELLQGLKATFDHDQDAFRVRMTRTFPETFFGWAQRLPPTVEFKPDEHLGSILADPLIARVRLEAAQTSTIDWFDLRVVFDIEGVELEAGGDPQAHLRQRRLRASGRWHVAACADRAERGAAEMVEQLGIDLNDLNEEAHRVHWRHLVGAKGAALLSAKAWAELQDRLAHVELNSRPEVPEQLTLTLRPYQIDGFHFLELPRCEPLRRHPGR